jgi:flagellar biosynthetic protein FliQ
MDAGTIIEIAQDSLIVLLKLSLPLLLVALVVGVLISLVQALTQIQEPTISFVPKIIAVFFSLLLSLNYMGSVFSSYMENIVSRIINLQ